MNRRNKSWYNENFNEETMVIYIKFITFTMVLRVVSDEDHVIEHHCSQKSLKFKMSRC